MNSLRGIQVSAQAGIENLPGAEILQAMFDGAFIRIAIACHKDFVSSPGMRIYIFLYGLTIVALGLSSIYLLDRGESLGFFQGAFTLGGGIVICGFFSLRMHWHGVIGAGVLALLGAGRGLGNVGGMAKFVSGDRSRGAAPILEFGVALICALLLLKIIRVLYQERIRRMLESQE